jgi:drug/metabolite transporter (DMT)-like permease
MAIGACILAIPFILSLRQKDYWLPARGIILAIAGGVCFGCDLSLWSTGVVISNATIPTLTANLAPLWVGFGSMLLFRQRLRAGFWIGLAVAIFGMLFLIRRNSIGDSAVAVGALLGLGAGMFYGMFYLFSESGRKLLNTIQYLFISTVSSAVLLTLFMLLFGYKFIGYDRFTYLMFFSIAIVVQVCGWFLINYSQGYIRASTVSPTLLGQPVLTFFLAVIFLGERLNFWQILGGAIVVTGIYIVHYSRHKESVKK